MKVSNCCGATVIENTDLCGDCKEHCEAIYEDIFDHNITLDYVRFKGAPEEFFMKACVNEDKKDSK